MNNPAQRDLFSAPALPTGMRYVDDFIDTVEEVDLLKWIATLPLQHSRYRQYTARRRTVSYGFNYDFADQSLHPAEAIPEFLHPLRARVAVAAQLEPGQFAQALVTEYQPGAPLGWHRDVPQFEVVVGVSLANPSRMRLRPYPPRRNERESVITLELQRRSIYVLRDEARWAWQHSIPPTKALRYSVTFRTLR